LKHFSAYHFLKANLTYVITYSTSIAEALESKILWSLASTPWYHQRKNIELSKSANWSSTSSPLLLLPHDMDCESGKPSSHTRWYRGSGACHYSDEEKWWWHWGDAIQASAPKDQNYAGRQGVHTLVVMSETPSIQRHSLSMSPEGLSTPSVPKYPPSQNISIYRLQRFTFDHSSCSKNLWKYYLFYYDMFYHHIYFKYIIIIFTFS